MQLLTSALRAHIAAIVRRALQNMPPHITPDKPQFIDWLDSLIRYHATNPLDPVEKPPVLGGVGIAEKADRWSEILEYYMDSGFVQLLPAAGAIWQNDETRALYSNYQDDRFELLFPKDGVDNGAVPPSFTDTSKYARVEVQKPGNYSGKLAWLVSGKYGLKTDDTQYSNLNGYLREYPANPRLSGEGVFTDENNRYWFIDIDQTGYAGTATFLKTKMQDIVDEAILDGITGDELIQIETHALAIAETTETIKIIAFSGDEPAGLPLGYGWKFNDIGALGVLVAHEDTGAENELTARKYKMVLAKTAADPADAAFTAVISTLAEGAWFSSSYTVTWVPDETESLRQHCPMAQHPSSPNVQDVIIYSYFKDDTLTDCLYSSQPMGNHLDLQLCGTGDENPIQWYTLQADPWRNWVELNRDTIEIDGESIESDTGTFHGIIEVNPSISITVEEKETAYIPLQLTGYASPCAALETTLWTSSCGGWGPFCAGEGTETQTKVSFFGTTYYRAITSLGDTNSGMAIIIPFDCTNGMTVVTVSKGDHIVDKKKRTDATNYSWKYQYSGQLVTAGWVPPPYTCDDVCSWDTPEAIKYKVKSGGVQQYRTSLYTEESHRYFFHDGGMFFNTEKEISEVAPPTNSPWRGWTSLGGVTPVCGGLGATTWSGVITDCVKSTAHTAQSYETDGDFPNDAEVTIGWA